MNPNLCLEHQLGGGFAKFKLRHNFSIQPVTILMDYYNNNHAIKPKKGTKSDEIQHWLLLLHRFTITTSNTPQHEWLKDGNNC
jgi:hypothetical protein